MSFFNLRELFVALCFFTFLALPRFFSLSEIPYWLTGVLINGIPLFLLFIHKVGTRKFQRDFDNSAYISAIMCITVFATFGSFSKEELIDFGFRFLLTEPMWAYFSLKLSFFFWSLTLLPVVIDKLSKKD
ncbi:hypothetical protein BKK52_00830 [Rodentibacter trehalosifermentans]|uniref:Uncharacterized protein n=2 Tax=Rodentibacter trehalosifermentans TaxID=1908263 RepID=A0A1V3J659_9PAST|nr:hypothetical protein BKK52_00830 [Rodentibacter trehalosifermentans]